MALGRIWMPAPMRWNWLACSQTVTLAPCRDKRPASASPPMPAPTMAMLGFVRTFLFSGRLIRHASRPRAATGSTSTTLSPRTAIMRSTMLTTTHTWLGMTRTTSPTFGRALLRARSRKPCSSA